MNIRTPLARYGDTNPSPENCQNMEVKRFASLIGLKPEKEQYYRDLHGNVWPTVLDRLRKSNIRNYSIYLTEIEGRKYLASYFEYVGKNFEADMKLIAADPETQRWWKETDPCQIPLPGHEPGSNWSKMEMLFFMA
jgi:L-rhamnose mutarotase